MEGENTMIKEGLIGQLKSLEEFFDRSSNCLTEEDAGFAPKEGMFTVTNHVAHTAHTVDWCVDGMFSPDGFAMNFEQAMKEMFACTSLEAARTWFKKSIANAVEIVGSKSDEELQQVMPKNDIMNGPRLVVIGAISDHTAHHRGALTVYARLLGKEPKMPYMDM